MHYLVLRALLHFYNEATFGVCLYSFPLSLLLSLSLSLWSVPSAVCPDVSSALTWQLTWFLSKTTWTLFRLRPSWVTPGRAATL